MIDFSWKELRIGDRVLVLDWPAELERGCLNLETVAVYDEIIAERIELTVHFIDTFGIPYGRFYRGGSSNRTSESIGLNHSGLLLVQREEGKGSGLFDGIAPEDA
jgi:hypothetical protein